VLTQVTAQAARELFQPPGLEPKAFYMVGGIEEAIEQGERLGRQGE
jgi:hypothetical protein